MTLPARRYLIDDLAPVLMRPAGTPPHVAPADVIAIVLTVTQWKPGRDISPDDVVVAEILRGFDKAGWKLVPIER